MVSELMMRKSLPDVVAEYDTKVAAIPEVLKDFKKAGGYVSEASTINGVYGNKSLSLGSVCERDMAESLLKSAWNHVYSGLNIGLIASAKDKKLFEQAMERPAPFTLDNIRATFGDFIADPRAAILRGMAEVFCDLDQAYKSHDKVRVGVKGLPKRVIISSCNSSWGYGRDKVRDILNALAAYQRLPLVDYVELEALWKDEDALLAPWVHEGKEWKDYPARGVSLRRFANGNGHLFFEPSALLDINRALAEYYGEVLPDCSDEKPTEKKTGTAVSKDLQYYPTPKKVVERVLDGLRLNGQKILEPSCGCGRFLDAIRKEGAEVFGIEYDAGRANEAKAKGHNVLVANFLETIPNPIYDQVVMNPPFYGKHYAKHVEHAMKFLKDGGILTCILPVTARYDHGLLNGHWHDLPVGSFSESGTNINTTVLTMRKKAC